MQNIKEAAKAYVPPQTLNIADLEKVSVEVPIENRIIKEGTPEEFSIMVALIGKKEYRVPGIVLKDLKLLINELPKMEHFKVIKAGSGISTQYTVIPLGV